MDTVKLAQLDVVVLDVCLVAGVPLGPDLAITLQVSVLTDHDVLGQLGGVPGPPEVGVGEPGQLGPDTVGVVPGGVIPGHVLEQEDLAGPARLDGILG